MTSIAVQARDIPVIGHKEGMQIAAAEYARFGDLIDSLNGDDWNAPTVCDGWTVRDVVVHILGEVEGAASLRENAHQMRLGRKVAKDKGYDHWVHGVNEVQINERSHVANREIGGAFRAAAPKAVKSRRRFPPLLRPVRLVDFGPPLGRRSMAYLMDRVLTRDPWMHRIDIARALGREPVLTAEHDGRIVADMVLDWAHTHGHDFDLELTGPAGGHYSQGAAGEHLTIDAIEWIWILSGRGDGNHTGLLAKELPL